MPCMRVDNYSEQGQQRWILHADEYHRLKPLLQNMVMRWIWVLQVT